jgi:hypothetical protein
MLVGCHDRKDQEGKGLHGEGMVAFGVLKLKEAAGTRAIGRA